MQQRQKSGAKEERRLAKKSFSLFVSFDFTVLLLLLLWLRLIMMMMMMMMMVCCLPACLPPVVQDSAVQKLASEN